MMRTSSATDPDPWSARARAAARHTRRVQIAKAVLPVAALIVLATMFLFLRNAPIGPPAPGSMRLTEGETEGALMTLPTFAGVGRDGAQVIARATSARPPFGTQQGGSAQSAEMRLIPPSGRAVEATAPDLVLAPAADLVILSGGVRLQDAAGYDTTMPVLRAATDASAAEGTGPVLANGPAGTLTAGGMLITRISGSPDYRMVFNQGVRLVYLPPTAAPEAGLADETTAAPPAGAGLLPKDAPQ